MRLSFTPALCLCLSLAACAPIVRTHGNMVSDEALSQIHTGVSRQADVAAVLGTPSAEGTFNPNEWYYVGQVSEQTAFFAPEITNRQVIKITFDPNNGTVTNIEKLDKTAGQEVQVIERTTPTAGHDLTVIEQVLGNVGRFSPPQKK